MTFDKKKQWALEIVAALSLLWTGVVLANGNGLKTTCYFVAPMTASTPKVDTTPAEYPADTVLYLDFESQDACTNGWYYDSTPNAFNMRQVIAAAQPQWSNSPCPHLSFDGSTDVITNTWPGANGPNPYQNPAGFTIMFWLRVVTNAPAANHFAHSFAAVGANSQYYHYDDRDVANYTTGAGSQWQTLATMWPSADCGKWKHVCIRTGPNSGALYTNAVLVGSIDTTVGIQTNPVMASLAELGATSGGSFWYGGLDKFCVMTNPIPLLTLTNYVNTTKTKYGY